MNETRAVRDRIQRVAATAGHVALAPRFLTSASN